MNDQNGFDSNGMYHYSYTSQHSDPWDRQTPPTPPQPPKKKKSGAGKAVALVLCCALVGGGAGVGGAAAYGWVSWRTAWTTQRFARSLPTQVERVRIRAPASGTTPAFTAELSTQY